MSYSENLEKTRRSVPREYDGAKNEWKALLDHYTEGELKSQGIEKAYSMTKTKLQRESKLYLKRLGGPKKHAGISKKKRKRR